jgi:hypothetical protein
VALFKTDYEEGRLQPTPGGHPQLAIPRANSPFYWLVTAFTNVIPQHSPPDP